jgi:hypothetical protein
LNQNNLYQNRLFFGNQLIATGYQGCEVRFERHKDSKKQALWIKLLDFTLVHEHLECPEEARYPDIQAAFGDKEKIAALHPVCEMIQMSPKACDGCPANPLRSSEDVIDIQQP